MKSSALLVDAGAMSTDTLAVAPPEALDTAEEPLGWDISAEVEAGAESAVPGEEVSAPATAPGGEAEVVASASGPGRMAVVLTPPLRAFVTLLVWIDIPFAFLGMRIKRYLGVVAIATAMVAAGTWLGGPYLVAAATHTKNPATAPAASGGAVSTSEHGGEPAGVQSAQQ